MSHSQSTWLVGFGGLGQAIHNRLILAGHDVLVISKREQPSLDAYQRLNYSDEDELKPLIASHSLPNNLIITSGLLYDETHQPEKSITKMNPDWLEKSIHSNVLPTLLFAKYITPKLNKSNPIRMICFSARVGSISDNGLGGWHSYRMTKAMLNMLIKNISIEWQRKTPESVIIGYHPGTVDTHLSKPFQSHLKPNQLFTPTNASEYFLDVFNHLKNEHSGLILDWQGKQVPY